MQANSISYIERKKKITVQPNKITYDPESLGEYNRQHNEETFFALRWIIEQINEWLYYVANPEDEDDVFDVSIYNFDSSALYLEILSKGMYINDHTQIISIINALTNEFKNVKLSTSKLEQFAAIYRLVLSKHDLDNTLDQTLSWSEIGIKNGLYPNPNTPFKVLTRVPLEYNEAVAIYANQYTNSIGSDTIMSVPVWFIDKIVPAYLDIEYLLEARYPEYDGEIARHVYLDTAGEVTGLTHGFNLAHASDYYGLFTYIELHLPDYKFNTSEDPEYIETFLSRIKDLCDNRDDIADKRSILSLLSDCKSNNILIPKTQYVTQSGWQLFYMGNYFVLAHQDNPEFMIIAARQKTPISSDEITETIGLFLSPYAEIVDKQSLSEPLGNLLNVINIYSYYIPELLTLAQECNHGSPHSVTTIDKIVLHYQPIDNDTAKLYVFNQDNTLDCRNKYTLKLKPVGETNE